MSVSKPSDNFHDRGKSNSSMRLPLHSAGDQNGNAFPISSSSSSSSSSSCLGESSPDSLLSLSSLSSCHTNSLLDCDMFELTMITRVMATTDKMTEVVVSKWTPDEESKKDNDDVFVGKLQNMTESGSNDNSVSVYLDANSDEYSQGTWNDNITLALAMTTNGYGDNDEISSPSSIEGGHSSSTPDSDATEVPADDDDDDDGEASFLSVSSDVGSLRASVTPMCSNSETSEGLLNLQPLETECSPPIMSTTVGPLIDSFVDLDGKQNLDEDSMKTMLGLQQPETQDLNGELNDSVTGRLAFEDVSEVTLISSATSSCTNQIANAKEFELKSPSEEIKRCVSGFKPALTKTGQSSRAAKTKPNVSNFTAAKMGASTAAKPSSVEAKRVPRQDLKNIKAKVASRPSPSTPKTSSQVLCLLAVCAEY